ncbi:TIGR00269 family protein [Candidatus Methanoperedens nitroreducens]|uniref:TIGR00269 family protein n=1 Tax=Candidatus Methanoperedens nitratireducens TaxID=1392998 RepID=A0A062V765_9EURY|nr:TIGR00269 family protein [Candidatus Methanoperedens nitroreducens]KCZ73157.1 TIGR00269 family protein [Candidatus Methanoperedens nitroreducens]MDJ1422893.1 TIGR00269 family protein [Candidatus Methanoperedens sp.]
MKCHRCSKSAVIHQRYSNAHLCRTHFIDDVERKIKRDIRKFKMVERGDRIAVALSGGKDSIVLLYVLHKVFQDRRDIELLAITIDEGIRGYREHTLKHAVDITGKLGIPHTIRSFDEGFRATLDDLTDKKEYAACTLCGVLRKNLLNKAARELGADKLAIGHNLDDEAQTILMNYLRGDMDRLKRMLPGIAQPGLVMRIKPLRSIPEKEVALYALLNNLPVSMDECPYAGEALRNEIREIINNYEVNHPGTKYSLLGGFDSISEALRMKPNTRIVQCNRCGEPSSEDVCKTCRLLNN